MLGSSQLNAEEKDAVFTACGLVLLGDHITDAERKTGDGRGMRRTSWRYILQAEQPAARAWTATMRILWGGGGGGKGEELGE